VGLHAHCEGLLIEAGDFMLLLMIVSHNPDGLSTFFVQGFYGFSIPTMFILPVPQPK
jgi:hypothetical protein